MRANPSKEGGPPLRSRGAHGGHHWRFERHRPGRCARARAPRRLASSCSPRGATGAARRRGRRARRDGGARATSPTTPRSRGSSRRPRRGRLRPARALPRARRRARACSRPTSPRYRSAFETQLHRPRARGHGVLAAARGEPRPARAGRVGRRARSRSRPSAPYAAAKSAALSWARSYGAAAREHGVAVTIVNPGPGADAGLSPDRAAAQPLGTAARGRRRALRRAAAGRRRPARARGLRAAVVARRGRASRERRPGLTARVAARAWRHDPRARAESRARHEPAGRARHRRQLRHRPRHRPAAARRAAARSCSRPAAQDRLDRLVDELGVTRRRRRRRRPRRAARGSPPRCGALGRLDWLVNNAGTGGGTAGLDVDVERARRVLETNFYSHVALTHELWPLLRDAPRRA